LQRLRAIMGRLKLTVNEEKTRICRVPEGEFDFLGHTFGRMYSARTGKAYIGYRPSKKSIKRMVENVHALTVRSGSWQDATELVGKLNSRALRDHAHPRRQFARDAAHLLEESVKADLRDACREHFTRAGLKRANENIRAAARRRW
jgi:hypothetical protein